MSSFLHLPDLAGERLGGAVPWATDEFFAPKENLVREAAPVWKEGEYTDRGKWMDGWETRRHRAPEHDWCIVRLGLPGVVRGFVIDTAFFRGNFPEAAAVEGIVAPADADAEALDQAPGWFPMLARSPLEGNHRNGFGCACPWRVTHLRLRMFPDGGIARLRVHGEPLPDPARLRVRGELDLACLDVGGAVEQVSDSFFSPPHHMLLPDAPRGMHDGWETKRRRGPGHDWAIVRLGVPGEVRRVVVDTSFFRGNFPTSAAVDAAVGAADGERWTELAPETPLRAHTAHEIVVPPTTTTHLRLRIYPDGGVARLRAFGVVTGWRALQRRWIDALAPEAAAAAFLTCCGSRVWARRMADLRPFDDPAAAATEAERGLAEADWLEAFAAHPPIGGSRPGSSTAAWSAQEQAGMTQADAALRDAMASGNRTYGERFGYTYIVCATGRSAEEMLTLLHRRLENDPATELRVAAAEQARITRIRLEKLYA